MKTFLFRCFQRLAGFEERLYQKLVRLYHRRRSSSRGRKHGLDSIGLMVRWRKQLIGSVYTMLCPRETAPVEVLGSLMRVDMDDVSITPSLLLYGVWEEAKTGMIKRILKKGMVVVDIGANIGYYTLIAAQAVGADGRVYAFEPEPKNYGILRDNLVLNALQNVIAEPLALSDRKQRLSLWHEKERMVNASFSKENVLSVLRHESLKDGMSVEVETISLDEYFKARGQTSRIDLIKLDAEGAEGIIIDGAQDILRHHDPAIIMEFWPEGLKNIGTDPAALLYKLQGLGFAISRINEVTGTAEPIGNAAGFYESMGADEGCDLFLTKKTGAYV